MSSTTMLATDATAAVAVAVAMWVMHEFKCHLNVATCCQLLPPAATVAAAAAAAVCPF